MHSVGPCQDRNREYEASLMAGQRLSRDVKNTLTFNLTILRRLLLEFTFDLGPLLGNIG
jgi:hypothetical protein